MAAESGPGVEHGHKFDAGFLKQKVGPLPLWVWLAAGLAVWYFLNRQQNSQATSAVDPGLDPATGETYASELGAATQQLSDLQGGQSGVAGGFASDQAWANAAVNYLVGLGVNATEASSAVEHYIGGQPMTAKEQADVNLAIQGIGAPPTVHPLNPGSTGAPPPAGGGTGKPAHAPTGLKVSKITSTSARIDWGPLANAQSYRVRVWTGKQTHDSTSADSHQFVSGLRPGTRYNVHVAGVNGAGMGPYSQTVTFSTLKK